MRNILISGFVAIASMVSAEPFLVLEIAGQVKGNVVIDLDSENAPKHVERIVTLAKEGAYDGVAFHRVIEGFMAQTGDVQYGKVSGDLSAAGTGGSSYPNLPAEFSDEDFDRGVVGMARSSSPDSANSQFFIMFKEGHFLNGQYTVVGKVTEGMDVVDQIKRGNVAQNGSVTENPDYIAKASIRE